MNFDKKNWLEIFCKNRLYVDCIKEETKGKDGRLESLSKLGGGANVMCVCLYQKSVCVKFTEPKSCTVDMYSTYESRYLYSLGEYICLLLII